MRVTVEAAIEIGGLPITVRCADCAFIGMLKERYANFLGAPARRGVTLEVSIAPPSIISAEEDLKVTYGSGRWMMRRGDFLAEWDPVTQQGCVRQSANPYAIDSVLRIIHSLVLARRAGLLLHSASAIRNGRAFLFSGVSGAGKTTIARLAPPDATLLTDEISYVRRVAGGFHAYGTPFAGELGVAGRNIAAPIAAIYFLAKGTDNRARPIPQSVAARSLLRNVLFFADDAALVEDVFRTACELVSSVPVYELTFRPDGEVWDLVA
ncbi:MAG TPA: hypothetical protein VEC38_04635 [Candidatus Binataceae bacterium]|nr:hypothetical protein [Candidatus Binataceae bacterium]